MNKMNSEMTFGNWKVIKSLGKGGNGKVYRVTNNKETFALKSLMKFSKDVAYSRFRSEVYALDKLKGQIEGIVKIIDYSLPENPTEENPPYYVMPEGIEINSYLKGKKHDILFTLFLEIAQAVADLHDKDFTHRDIKPNNILVVNDRAKLSDFGLVSYPEKDKISPNKEKIGPVWTIAPEMKRNSNLAEFKKADVYSLGKTLWILITGIKEGFEGKYIPDSSISIDKYVEFKINTPTIANEWNYFSKLKLDELLEKATDNNPNNRPTAREFYAMLNEWYSSNLDFNARNAYEWKDVLRKLFPIAIPVIASWTNPEDIVKVLKLTTQYDSLNYCFLPGNGGEEIKSVGYAPSSDYIIMNNYGILRPESLEFNYLGDNDWVYFRIILSPLRRLSKDMDEYSEEYLANDKFEYLQEHTDYSEGINIVRYLKGSMIIVHKTGSINELKGTYKGFEVDGHSGIHDKIPHEEYNALLKEVRKRRTANI